MLARRLLSQVFDDHALTRGLGDAEARVLVEWLVERAEVIAASDIGEEAASHAVGRFRHRARTVSRFVALWCHLGERGAAGQLAAAERFHWPLPEADADPCELMQAILAWEEQHVRKSDSTRNPSIQDPGFRSIAS
ncbi:MAG TPA: hypothetical protein VKE94_23350 [Gemmataceae bacterium]|nr:hypothetical protein [Gemmataceae bacterium]